MLHAFHDDVFQALQPFRVGNCDPLTPGQGPPNTDRDGSVSAGEVGNSKNLEISSPIRKQTSLEVRERKVRDEYEIP